MLHPTPAFHVDMLTPSQVAGTLGLDEMPTISAVPFEDRPLPPARERDTTGAPPRRIREIVQGV